MKKNICGVCFGCIDKEDLVTTTDRETLHSWCDEEWKKTRKKLK